MPEPATDKWKALADKLDSELVDTKQRHGFARMRARRAGISCLAVAVAAGGGWVAAFLAGGDLAQLLAPLLLLPLILCLWIYIQASRRVGFAQVALDQVERDIRQWKKQKPKTSA